MIITASEVKSILQITGTTYDTWLTANIPLAESFALNYTGNPFHTSEYAEGYTFSFAGSKIISTDAEDFFYFPDGLYVDVVNSKFNDGLYKVTAKTALEITVDATLIAETADTYNVQIYVSNVPEGFKIALAQYIDSLLKRKAGNLQSERIGDYSYTIKEEKELLAGYFAGFRKVKVA